jgi:putative membrane protein
MISVPIVAGRGEAYRGRAISIGVVAQVMVVAVTLFGNWPAAKAIVAAVLVPVLGWLAEFIGSRTGIPFGRYHYTEILQPQFHRVPIAIPFAWLMMLPPSWAVAQVIAQVFPPESSRLIVALLSGYAFTAWDVYLDPHLVGWRFWEWEEHGRYEGIPFKNFFGWFLWSAAITFIVDPAGLPLFPLVPVYVLTWLFQFGGHIAFWGRPVSGTAGFLAMGIVSVPAVVLTLFI